MSSKSIVSVLTGFLSHHAADLAALDGALSSVLMALPINAQTRETVQTEIERLRESANAIAAAVATFANNPPTVATIKRSDIDRAVADGLPGALAAYFEANPASAGVHAETPAGSGEAGAFTGDTTLKTAVGEQA